MPANPKKTGTWDVNTNKTTEFTTNSCVMMLSSIQYE